VITIRINDQELVMSQEEALKVYQSLRPHFEGVKGLPMTASEVLAERALRAREEINQRFPRPAIWEQRWAPPVSVEYGGLQKG